MDLTINKPFIVILLCMSVLTFAACSKSPVENKLSAEAPSELQSQTLPSVSVQLWSVKDDVKQDFKGTLQRLASMGFQGVEFAGEFGGFADNPTGLSEFLKTTGLKASGAHVPFEYLSPENLEETVAFYKAIGCNMLIIPVDNRAWDPEGVKDVVSELNVLAEKLALHDMKVGYHNHAEEFQDYEGSTYWDYIASSTSEKVVLQLDVGWVNYAGKDPIEYVNRYPGRTFTTHYKIRTPEGVEGLIPIIGQDNFNWTALLKVNVEFGGTRWLVVEQEEYPNDMTPMESVQASKSGLDKIMSNYDM